MPHKYIPCVGRGLYFVKIIQFRTLESTPIKFTTSYRHREMRQLTHGERDQWWRQQHRHKVSQTSFQEPKQYNYLVHKCATCLNTFTTLSLNSNLKSISILMLQIYFLCMYDKIMLTRQISSRLPSHPAPGIQGCRPRCLCFSPRYNSVYRLYLGINFYRNPLGIILQLNIHFVIMHIYKTLFN